MSADQQRTGDFHDEEGRRVQPDDPQRLLWYGSCGYWTDDWSKPVPRGPGIPCCPECGAPGFQVTAGRWFDGMAKYEADGHPGYSDGVNARREKCPRKAAAAAAARKPT